MTQLQVLIFAVSVFVTRTEGGLVLWQPRSATEAMNRTAEFNCSISNGSLQWKIQLYPNNVLYWPLHSATLLAREINASYTSPQLSVLRIRATYINNGTLLQCLSDMDPLVPSLPVALTVYDRPTPPINLRMAPAGNLVANISWNPSFSLPSVSTTYAVFFDGKVTALVSERSHYAFRYSGSYPCRNHSITVVAGNAAGDSDPSETLVTDIPQVGQFIADPTSTVRMNDLAIRVASQVVTCPSFPLQQLYIQLRSAVTTSAQTLGPYVPTNDGTSVNTVIHKSDGLQPNTNYIYLVTVVNAAGNSTSRAQTVYTTDVQSSTITGSDHQLNVTCSFAEGSLAKGCVVLLERSGEVVQQMISRENGTARGVIRTELSVGCYNISIVDWEEDGSIGSLDVPASGTVSTDCEEAATLAFEEFIYIISGVCAALLVIVAAFLIITIAVCCRPCTAKKDLDKQGIERGPSAYQNTHQPQNTADNTFASDPVYSSSILYMGNIPITGGNKPPNEKVTAINGLSHQWTTLLTPPTPIESSSLNYSRLHHQQSTCVKPPSTSAIPPSLHTAPAFITFPHHYQHPPTVHTSPIQQRHADRDCAYELTPEHPLVREDRQRQNLAFTDV